MNLRLPPDPAMVVKSPKISTSLTLETHNFANKEEARETIFKVLKNWHASDINCKKIFDELNAMAQNSRDCLVLVDGRPVLQLTVKVILLYRYVLMKNNSNCVIISTNSSEGNCLLCKNELVGNLKVTRMSCSHMFHINCIRTWLMENNGCPSCFANVDGLADSMISSMQF
uniref:RING-H2 finger protein ATL16-like n=1 Tax=Nicotiana tabacum TaxID=4097 RepID=A0A1S4BI35_TOBAC|nr:PREDICTED: RING-H2 finger protein ATL16-like [Nicotiana tabacum]